MSTVLQSILIVLAMPSFALAETFVYFRSYKLEVPAPLMLLIAGLALIAVGAGLRKWAHLKHWPSARPDA